MKKIPKSKIVKKSITTFLLPVLVVVVLVAVVVGTKYVGENRSRANYLDVIRVPETPVTNLLPDMITNSSDWALIKDQNNQIKFDTSIKEMIFVYSGNGNCYADYSLKSATRNFALRGMFYDDMQNKGSLFMLVSPTNPVDGVGLGVNTLVSQDKYVYRLDTYGSTRASHISRSLGWHLFEILVTDSGTFFKIDGNFVYILQGQNTNLAINPSITSSSKVRLVSSWKLVGSGGTATSKYKNIQVVKMDNQSSEVQLLRGLGYFYNNYRNVNFVYPSESETNHLSYRLLFNTIQAFYAYGVKTSNPSAIDQSKNMMNNFLNSGRQMWPWEYENAGEIWEKATQISTFASALQAMKGDLDEGSLDKGKLMLKDQLKYYIWLSTDFEEDTPLDKWMTFAGSTMADVSIVDLGLENGNTGHAISLNNSISGKPIFIKHNFNSKWTTTDANHYFHPIRARVRFYDDGDNSLGTMFGLYKTGSQDSVGIGVQTGISSDKYVIRTSNATSMHATNVSRSIGWHTFELVTEYDSASQRGVAVYVDDRLVGKSVGHYFSESVYLLSTWNLPGNAIYDDLTVTRIPISRYIGDSAAEENSWDAAALAMVTNYFPDAIEQKDRQLVDSLILCYAYHSLTVGSDSKFCNLKTQTLSSNYEIANHGLTPNPLYQFSTMGEIVAAMNSYKVVGKSAPEEFEHHLKDVFDSAMGYLDTNTCLFKGTENITKDMWSGATRTPFQYGTGILLYAQEKGWLSGEFVNKCFNLRNLYFYDVANNFRRTTVTEHILMRDKVNPPPNDSFTMFQSDWKLDSILAGEANVGAALKALP